MLQENPVRACILVFGQMDLVDFSGPLETLYHAYEHGTEDRLISIEVAAPTEEILTEQGVIIKRNISFEQALESLPQYDILVAPGASYKTTKAMCESPDNSVINIIKQFCSLPATQTKTRQRIMLSICSGSFFLATAGLLAGRRATTHFTRLPQLEQAAAKHGRTEVSRHRFVDAGLLDNGVRIVSSGGLTSCFDAALYAIELLCGLQSAEFASEELDYQWRKSEALF
ncbi:ThiJ/PfpI family protein [Talaromyces proteolyticus]|uniref:ThiJ/PfpI family protein n=1 Tax=Talaromyces proteolyticus TaxID=1131652 RepID=A0AAD4PV09_9EURO|nr:ThiJ/PfpI family protein [Talaromyces proteolyticus]KAH8690729.1 ThiJ/PfpI family protein [Talaromyces proteolyticus]